MMECSELSWLMLFIVELYLYRLILYFPIDEEIDKEALSELACSGSYDQLKACGFVKVKDQLKLQKLFRPQVQEERCHDSVGNHQRKEKMIHKHNDDRKLTIEEIRMLSSDDKRLYLLK